MPLSLIGVINDASHTRIQYLVRKLYASFKADRRNCISSLSICTGHRLLKPSISYKPGHHRLIGGALRFAPRLTVSI